MVYFPVKNRRLLFLFLSGISVLILFSTPLCSWVIPLWNSIVSRLESYAPLLIAVSLAVNESIKNVCWHRTIGSFQNYDRGFQKLKHIPIMGLGYVWLKKIPNSFIGIWDFLFPYFYSQSKDS